MRRAADGAEARVQAMAERQLGCISSAQLMEAGFGRATISRRARSGRWKRVLPGVYRLWRHGDSIAQQISEVVLWAGEGAVASHTSAAYLLKLESFGRGHLEVTIPRDRRLHHPGVRVHQSIWLGGEDVLRREWPPRTNIGRTLVDLSDVLTARRMELVFDSVWRRYNRDVPLWTIQALARLGRRSRSGMFDLERLVRDRLNEPTDSELEALALLMIRDAQLPMPLLHYRITGVFGNPEVDFVWRDRKVLLETDGFGTHGRYGKWLRDIRVRRSLAELGWQVVQASREDILNRPEEVVRALRTALSRGFVDWPPARDLTREVFASADLSSTANA